MTSVQERVSIGRSFLQVLRLRDQANASSLELYRYSARHRCAVCLCGKQCTGPATRVIDGDVDRVHELRVRLIARAAYVTMA
jgi:hypothetical protein